jgi:hypothetical protein
MALTAAVTETAGGPFVLSEVELGKLRPDEVLVHDASAADAQAGRTMGPVLRMSATHGVTA